LNRQTNEQDFPQFYRAAYRLKDLLSQSWREMEEDHLRWLLEFWKNQAGEGAIGNGQTEWGRLLNYVGTNETKDFMKQFVQPGWNEKNADNTPKLLLPLMPSGIYKRIRMLSDVLHRQRASAHLDWLTRRFDFLGCRLTCLYKNQVFALYEQIWNQGDAFFLYDTETEDPNAFRVTGASGSGKRTRWLCLRTNVHEDEYRALQVAALSDPSAIESGHWGRRGYNLLRLKSALGKLFGTYESDVARNYEGYARNRNRFRLEYLKWFRVADAKTRVNEDTRAIEVAQGVDVDCPEFGEFLCEAVFDLVLERFDRGGAKALKNVIEPLSKKLREFLKLANIYTKDLLKNMEVPGVAFRPGPALRKVADDLYDAALKLANRNLDDEREHLEKERRRLLGASWRTGRASGVPWPLPAIWVPADRFMVWDHVLRARGDSGDAKLERLARLWEAVRREQKEFLFYRSEKPGEHPGLRLRERQSVLDRIMNYVLLFDPTRPLFEGKEFEGWTAYNLFYYVRSLIPVEIQIRTAFADTMAEQYHDAIYKGRPKKGTEAPRKRLEELSRRLAELDNEMEIDFEDFAVREMDEDSAGKMSGN
jgi:hypothetical protein